MQWAILKYFRVLPTDPRFLSLTTEQLDYIYESFILDGELRQKKNEEATIKQNVSPTNIGTTEYFDPEFEELWNEIEEEHNNIVGQGISDEEGGILPTSQVIGDFNEEWKEVE